MPSATDPNRAIHQPAFVQALQRAVEADDWWRSSLDHLRALPPAQRALAPYGLAREFFHVGDFDVDRCWRGLARCFRLQMHLCAPPTATPTPFANPAADLPTLVAHWDRVVGQAIAENSDRRATAGALQAALRWARDATPAPELGDALDGWFAAYPDAPALVLPRFGVVHRHRPSETAVWHALIAAIAASTPETRSALDAPMTAFAESERRTATLHRTLLVEAIGDWMVRSLRAAPQPDTEGFLWFWLERRNGLVLDSPAHEPRVKATSEALISAYADAPGPFAESLSASNTLGPAQRARLLMLAIDFNPHPALGAALLSLIRQMPAPFDEVVSQAIEVVPADTPRLEEALRHLALSDSPLVRAHAAVRLAKSGDRSAILGALDAGLRDVAAADVVREGLSR